MPSKRKRNRGCRHWGVGSVTVEATGQVELRGVEATGAVGSVTVGEGSGVPWQPVSE